MANPMENLGQKQTIPTQEKDNSRELFNLEEIIRKARASQECIKGLEELNIDVEERHNVLVPGTSTTPEKSMQLLKKSIKESGEVTLYTSVDICPYICKFCRYNNRTANSQVALSAKIDENISDLNQGTSQVSQELLGGERAKVSSLYIGGGTPTLMNEAQMKNLFDGIQKYYDIEPEAEITMESTPDTIDDEKIALMKRMGVNRISMGVQRMDDEWLKEMGRKHSSADVLKALDAIKRNGIRFNVDLIYGFEGQSVKSFCEDLLKILESEPSEITIYRYEGQKRTDDRNIKNVGRNQSREDIYAMQEAGRQILQGRGYTEGPRWLVY